MIKKFFKGLWISFLCMASLALVLYCLMAYYYRNGFSYGTYINGVYCTGKTIEEVNNELLRNIGNYQGLTVTDISGKSYTVSAEDVGLKYDFTENPDPKNQESTPKSTKKPEMAFFFTKKLSFPKKVLPLPRI